MLKSDHPSSMREELAEHTRNLSEDVQVPISIQFFIQFKVENILKCSLDLIPSPSL